jgi:hypothetical protein
MMMNWIEEDDDEWVNEGNWMVAGEFENQLFYKMAIALALTPYGFFFFLQYVLFVENFFRQKLNSDFFYT